MSHEVPHSQYGNSSTYIFHELVRNAMPPGDGRISYRKGDYIFEEGKHANGLYCIISGKVKITRSSDGGKEQILRLAATRDIIGYRALLNGNQHRASAIALEDTMVGYVPRTIFFDILNSNPKVVMEMLHLLSHELDESETRRVDIATKSVKERLAEVLLLLKESYGLEEDGQTLSMRLSRDDLAGMVGAAKEVVIRNLTQLKEEGLVESKGRQLKLINIAGLLKAAQLRD